MGKQKRTRQRNVAANAKPYSRDTAVMNDAEPEARSESDKEETTVADSVEVNKEVVDEKTEAESDPSQKLTRGAILQRHKLEYKKVRAECEDLRRQSKKLTKKDLQLKQERKSMVKDAKRIMDEMLAKHKAELEDFDKQQAQSMA